MKKIIHIIIISLLIGSCSKDKVDYVPVSIPGTVTDIDGNLYHTVVIGDQTWLVENLKVTKFVNGDPIENVTGTEEWSTLTSGAWSYYINDGQYNDPYGKLYNGYAVIDPRKICPEGWHVPEDEEWTILETFIGTGSAGGALKELGTVHWESPNTGATNLSGFTALPGGYRAGNGEFPLTEVDNLGFIGLWWSSTDYDDDYLWIRGMGHNFYGLVIQEGYKKAGLSCRCIKD